MNHNKLLKRTKLLLSIILAIVIVFVYFLIGQTSVVKGLNVKSDELQTNTMEKIYRQETIEGSILDRSGEVISESDTPGEGGILAFPEAYSWLIGYNTSIYGSYGLKAKYENYLYMRGKDNQGATIKLTVDNRLQTKAYNLIAGTTGSMIVLDVHTGEILALASSRPVAFNANELDANWEEWNSIEGYFLPNGYKDAAEPGSTFKMVTTAAILEHGLEDETVEDTGSTILSGHTVNNVGKVGNGTIGLSEALGTSSNVYFATKAVELGGAVMKSKCEDFLIGQDIPLDFTTLSSNLDLGNYSTGLVADTGYGQGKTLVTPLQLAMIAQSIANDGQMLKPYLIDSIELDGKGLYEGDTENLAVPVSKKTAQSLKEQLKITGETYYGMEGICAKTGTAELPQNMLKCYMVSFNEDYVVVASKTTESGYGMELKGQVLSMYQYLDMYQTK